MSFWLWLRRLSGSSGSSGARRSGEENALGLWRNSINFRRFDEDLLETLFDMDAPFIGYECVACRRRNCVRMHTFEGKEIESLHCEWLVLFDGKHWKPICDECVASFTPPSTVSKLFRL